MFNWILSMTLGAIVAFLFVVYMIFIGLLSSSIIMLGLLIFGYVAAVVALLLD